MKINELKSTIQNDKLFREDLTNLIMMQLDPKRQVKLCRLTLGSKNRLYYENVFSLLITPKKVSETQSEHIISNMTITDIDTEENSYYNIGLFAAAPVIREEAINAIEKKYEGNLIWLTDDIFITSLDLNNISEDLIKESDYEEEQRKLDLNKFTGRYQVRFNLSTSMSIDIDSSISESIVKLIKDGVGEEILKNVLLELIKQKLRKSDILQDEETSIIGLERFVKKEDAPLINFLDTISSNCWEKD